MKKILTLTAAAALMAAPALAGNENTEAKANLKLFDQSKNVEQSVNETGFVKASAQQMRTSNLVGSYIYNGVGEDAETIGDINDILLSPDGKVAGVLVGVGGFLGIGEKDVLISIDKLKMRAGEDGERWIVSEYSRSELVDAPTFESEVLENNTFDRADDKTTKTSTE